MKYVDLKEISGKIPACKELKKSHYKTLDFDVSGDAPKDFIEAYFYKKDKIRAGKRNLYIAKVGHKHYPIESITEHLLNKIGEIFEMKMAESELAFIRYSNVKQIRFFSKFFLNRNNEQLIHGADIYATYLGDENIIKQIEKENKERELITVQDAKLAIAYLFPKNIEIFEQYIRLLLFDALVGNSDRHFYNWGCVKPLKGEGVTFSPIYDTARGLFWNYSDSDIIKWYNNKEHRNIKLNTYTRRSIPKVGWEGLQKVNHFELVGLIFEHELGLSKETITNYFDVDKLNDAKNYIQNGPFRDLYITERLQLIIECLDLRYNKIKEIISA